MSDRWQDACLTHPEHQTGIVSNQMIQDRMQEEIDRLRGEVRTSVKQDAHKYAVRKAEEFLERARRAEAENVKLWAVVEAGRQDHARHSADCICSLCAALDALEVE